MSITNFKKINSSKGIPVAPSYVDINTPTLMGGAYTVSSTDIGDLVRISSSTQTVVNLPNDSVVIPVGSTVSITQWGTGKVAIAPANGVTIKQEPAVIISSTGLLMIKAQYSRVELVKVGANEWLSDGYGIYVQATAPTNPQIGDLWFW